MDLSSATNPQCANAYTTKRTTETSPISSSAQGTASIFNNAHNLLIMGGTFNNTTNTTNLNTINGLGVLHKRVAPNAILNTGGRADKVRCHPGTREEVIVRIEKWRDGQDDLTAPIFWLSGPAGAGKSAIMQTIAERCKAQGVSQANFFFFRADSSRSTVSPLVATLLHQIIQLYPSLRSSVASVFSDNPLVLESVFEEQLEQLLVMPLCDIQRASSSYSPVLLLIDGLDECDSENSYSQRHILHALDKVLVRNPGLFRVLVASREESQIRMAFNEMYSPLLPLYLDSQYSPERDILIFVNDQFKRIRKAHPLAHTLNANWPSVKDIKGIVEKSSGQFIYAATVMQFISDSSASPILSLERVQGAAEITAKSPFSHLDAIYTHILSQVDNQEALKDILHTQLQVNYVSSSMELAELLQIYNPKYVDALVRSCMADLTSIARYTDSCKLVFHHASFSDYLWDKSRSGDYFVDIDAFYFKIMPALWKCIELAPGVERLAYSGLRRLRKLPPNFLSTLSALNPSNFNLVVKADSTLVRSSFKIIYNLCACDEDKIKYKQIMARWINTLEDHDICHTAQDTEHPPWIRKYCIMALIQRGIAIEPSVEIASALRPETDFDIHETAIWLNDILHRIHGAYYPQEIQYYQQLIEQWISWAVWNKIPLDGLDNIPDFRWYFWKVTMGKWAARYLKFGNGEL